MSHLKLTPPRGHLAHKLSGLLIALFALALLAPGITACGGAQEPEPAMEAPAPPPPTAAPAPQVDDRIWYVYFRGIHALSVYPTPGPVNSYGRRESTPPFGENHPGMSVISEYRDQESRFAPIIAESTDAEDFISRVEGLDEVEVEESINPVYAD